MEFIKRISTTDGGIAPAVLRLALGLVMFPHGAQKLLGWFGGYGYTATVDAFQTALGLPPVITLLVMAVEFIGGLALILGAFSRLAAAGVIAVMLGAVATVHVQNGFFMNWAGSQQGEGFEYHILAIGLAIAVGMMGSGAFSLDRLMALHQARR